MFALFALVFAAYGAPKLELTGEIAAVDGLDLCFGSGLRIAYMVDPSHPTVTISSVYDSGGTSDPVGKEGVAHVVEHLWFRSAQRGFSSVDLATDELGAWANASTGLDDTVYETVGPVAAVDTLLGLEVDRLQHPLAGITQEILDIEREVVRNELRERVENSAAVGLATLRQQVYPPGHAYNRSIVGTHETLDGLTLKDVDNFAAEHYRADNVTWVITGPWSRSEFAKVLGPNLPDELVVDIERPDLPLGSAPCPNRSAERESFDFKPAREALTVEAGVTEPVGLFGWAMPSGFSHDFAQSQRAIWSLDSALYDYGADCNINEGRDASLGYCRLPLGHVRPAEREAYLRDALDQIAYLWDRSYLSFQNRTYRRVVGDQMSWAYRSLETETTYHPGARNLHHTGRFDTLFDYMRQLQMAASDRDSGFMEEWINQRRAATVILTPQVNAGTAGVNRHAQTPSAPNSASDAEIGDSAIRDLTHVQDLKKLRTLELSNGLKVWILPMKAAPFAHVSLVMEGNVDSAPSAAIDFLRDIFHEDVAGTVVEDEKLSLAPELIGGNWFSNATRTTTTQGIRGASGNLDGLLYLLRKRIDRSRVSIESRRHMYLRLDEQKWRDRDYVETWEKKLFDTHLGRISTVLTEGLVEEIKTVGAQAASDWNRHIYSPVGATLIIAGNVDVAQADKLARLEFADWRDRSDAGPPEVHMTSRPEWSKRRIVLLNDTQRTNADIHAACLLPEVTDDNGEVRRVMGAGLEAMLRQELRERQGATYGVSGWTARESNGLASLHVQTDVQSDAAGSAISAIFRGIEVMESEVSEAEIQRWKLTLARKSVLDQRTYSEIRHELEWAVTSGDGLEGLQARPERLAEVRRSDIQAQLAGCSGAELVTVAGPIADLRDQLDEAGLDYEVLEWEALRDSKMAELDPRRWRAEQRERKQH